MVNIGMMIAMIILACAVHKYVEQRTKGSVPGGVEQRLMARMDELDRRLTDIQDVMISLDDKLERVVHRHAAPVAGENGERIIPCCSKFSASS